MTSDAVDDDDVDTTTSYSAAVEWQRQQQEQRLAAQKQNEPDLVVEPKTVARRKIAIVGGGWGGWGASKGAWQSCSGNRSTKYYCPSLTLKILFC